jgi:hypothetical protein
MVAPEEVEPDGTIEWVDEEGSDGEDANQVASIPTPSGDPYEAAQAELSEAPARTKPRRSGAPRPTPSGARSNRSPRSSSSPVAVTVTKREPRDLGAWARTRRNPLIFAAVVAVVIGTVAFRAWRSRLAELPQIAEKGRSEGLAALDAGQFDVAYKLLSEARRAVQTLGDEFPGSSAIKQAAGEAEIITRLVVDPLEQLLDEASRSDPDAWDDQFRKLYKGRTIIIESEITVVPNANGEGRYDLRYRIFPNGEGARPRRIGKIETKGFKHFDVIKPKLHDTVIFGAALASFSLDAETGVWLVGLEPDSGVIMTHHKALEALGWDPPEKTAASEEL